MFNAPSYRFTFYRFVGPTGQRTTEVVRDLGIADGMRGLVERHEQVQEAITRVSEWAELDAGLVMLPREMR